MLFSTSARMLADTNVSGLIAGLAVDVPEFADEG